MTSSLPPVPAMSPGMAEASLAIGGEALGELRERHLGLAAAIEVAHGRGCASKLVLADQDGGTGMDLVGSFQAPADIAAIAEVDVEAGPAQLARDPRCYRLALLDHRYHRDRPVSRGRVA